MVTGVTTSTSSSPETTTPTPQSAAVMDRVGDDVSEGQREKWAYKVCPLFNFFFLFLTSDPLTDPLTDLEAGRGGT